MADRVPIDLIVRVAQPKDAEAIFRLVQAHGAGLTNLPCDRARLSQRIDASLAALAAPAPKGADPLMLVLEADGVIGGTATLFPCIGLDWPFYSYKINRLSQTSRRANRSVAYEMLTLTNDLDGASEVAGLLVDPALRRLGAGRLIARSRYLFMAVHRALFNERVVAELRGWRDETGAAPVWEAIGRRFYDMSFDEADGMSAAQDSQFIADLSPRHPIYTNLLPHEARAALGRPHLDSQPAYDLLIEEGFRFEGYVDIFDGGPSVVAQLDTLKAVRNSDLSRVIAVAEPPVGAAHQLATSGEGAAFRAGRGTIGLDGDGATISPALARALGVSPGEDIHHVAF